LHLGRVRSDVASYEGVVGQQVCIVHEDASSKADYVVAKAAEATACLAWFATPYPAPPGRCHGARLWLPRQDTSQAASTTSERRPAALKGAPAPPYARDAPELAAYDHVKTHLSAPGPLRPGKGARLLGSSQGRCSPTHPT